MIFQNSTINSSWMSKCFIHPVKTLPKYSWTTRGKAIIKWSRHPWAFAAFHKKIPSHFMREWKGVSSSLVGCVQIKTKSVHLQQWGIQGEKGRSELVWSKIDIRTATRASLDDGFALNETRCMIDGWNKHSRTKFPMWFRSAARLRRLKPRWSLAEL